MRTIHSQIARRGSGRKHLKTLVEGARDLAEKNAAKKHFNEKFHHPRSERIHESIPASPFAQVLRAFREKHNIYAKEAAGALKVPTDTYRGWESGKHTPHLIVQREITTRMRDYVKPTPG